MGFCRRFFHNIRVTAPLDAQGRHWAVAGDEAHVVAQREEPLPDGRDQLGVVSPREVGTTNGPTEEHIADLGETPPAIEEHDMPRGMAGAMDHLQGLAPQDQTITPFEPALRLEVWHRREAEELTLRGQGPNQEIVVAVGTDNGYPELRGQDPGGTDVIEMPMGEEDALGTELEPGQQFADAPRIATGVDDGRLASGLTPKEGAILLEWGDRQDAEFQQGLQRCRDDARWRAPRPGPAIGGCDPSRRGAGSASAQRRSSE